MASSAQPADPPQSKPDRRDINAGTTPTGIVLRRDTCCHTLAALYAAAPITLTWITLYRFALRRTYVLSYPTCNHSAGSTTTKRHTARVGAGQIFNRNEGKYRGEMSRAQSSKLGFPGLEISNAGQTAKVEGNRGRRES